MFRSIFGIDITGDGKDDILDDLIIMELLDDEEAEDEE